MGRGYQTPGKGSRVTIRNPSVARNGSGGANIHSVN